MANKIRKILALMTAFALIAGQLTTFAAATETTEDTQEIAITVDVTPKLPELPGSDSQIPPESENVLHVESDPVSITLHNPVTGVVEQSTTTSTTWYETEGDTFTTGTETTTTVTGTDDYTGQTLFESGTTSGKETTVTESTATETEVLEDYTTGEVTTQEKTEELTEENTSSITEEEESTQSGQWEDVGPVQEGSFTATATEEWTADPITTPLGEEVIPEEGITIELHPDTDTEEPNDYTGTANGAIIPLTEGMEIPKDAELIRNEDGAVVGYISSVTTEKITDSTTLEGEAVLDEASSVTDTIADISDVTPDLEAAQQQLGIAITDNSVITEEKDADGNVTAYVVTNTTESAETIRSIDEMVRPESSVTTDESGNTMTVTTVDILDEAGNVVGFETRKMLTDATGKLLSDTTTTQTIVKTDLPEAAAPVITYTLPDKPAESSVTNEAGVTTTVTVREILDDKGLVIGYTSTTVQIDEAGAELFRSEENIYGTETTVTEAVSSGKETATGSATLHTKTVETSRVTAEQEIYNDVAVYTRLNQIVNEMTVETANELVMIDGKLYYIYTGSVNVTEGKQHGDTQLIEPLDIMESLYQRSSKDDLISGGGTLYNVSTDAPAEGFKYIGYGIDTALDISKGNSSSDVIQFRLKGSNNKIYHALCIDYNTTIKNGHLYDIADLSSENYYQQEGSVDIASAEKLRIIALNGYWGTADDPNAANDIGSLEEVKNLLTDYLRAEGNLSEEEINAIAGSLTPGQALAATQAALWKYGNINGSKKVNEDNLVPNGWNKDGSKNEDYLNTEYVYKALLDLANDPDTQLEADQGVEFLDAEDITATSIVVKEKVMSAEDTSNTSGANVYNTDLNFTLGIEPTKLIGDLKVTVYDNSGNKVDSYILASPNVLDIGLKPDENGIYTIPNVQIAEGVTVNLKLSGTQDLGTGVYIYTSLNDSVTDSQTLITLATGKRSVDLDIEMKLDVQTPTATKESSGTIQEGIRTDTQKQVKQDETTKTETTTTVDVEVREQNTTVSRKVYTADVTLTTVTETESKSSKSWSFSWLKNYEPETDPHDDDGDTPTENDDNLDEDILIPDEEVPLAKAPQTGDVSYLWAAISLISLVCAGMLTRKKQNA